MILGLTGGIGTGKSTVSAQFAALGLRLIDGDVISRELVRGDSPALREIVASFGVEMLGADGQLDRARLRQRVFNDDEARRRLNRIMHPRIRQALLLALEEPHSSPYQVLSVPLLIENNLLELVDCLCVVDIPEALQWQRLRARDNSDEATLRGILAAQCSRFERLSLANYVIDNSGSVGHCALQVGQLHQHLLGVIHA